MDMAHPKRAVMPLSTKLPQKDIGDLNEDIPLPLQTAKFKD